MVKFKLEDDNVKAERVKEFFALLPVKIGEEIQWGERVTIKQEFRYSKGWYNAKFINEAPKLGDSRLHYYFCWRLITIHGWTRWLKHITVSEIYDGSKWVPHHFAHYL